MRAGPRTCLRAGGSAPSADRAPSPGSGPGKARRASFSDQNTLKCTTQIYKVPETLLDTVAHPDLTTRTLTTKIFLYLLTWIGTVSASALRDEGLHRGLAPQPRGCAGCAAVGSPAAVGSIFTAVSLPGNTFKGNEIWWIWVT